MFLFLIGLALLALAGGLFYTGRKTQRKARLLSQSAPIRAAEIGRAFPGEMVSLSGTARSDHELLSEYAEQPCIYFASSIERDYEVTRGTRGKTDRSKGTETVHSQERSVPFSVEDETGRVHVIPEGAEFDAPESFSRYEPADQRQSSHLSGLKTVDHRSRSQTVGHRYVEHAIPLDGSVFVVGVVNEDGHICQPAPNRKQAGFFISYRDESSLQRAWENEARKYVYGALGSGLAGLVIIIAVLMSPDL
jgi:hypothetical protein